MTRNSTIMAHAGGATHSTPARRFSPDPPSTGKRKGHHDAYAGHHRTKKQKFASADSETRIRVHTLKPKLRTHREWEHRHTRSFGGNDGGRPKLRRRRTRCRRKWTYSTRDVSDYKDRVVIVSYNILAAENARNHPELYRDVRPKHLDWEYRKNILCKEIKKYQASVLCFQEVDHFDDLNDCLGEDGFRGLYKARGGEARDGCAIFWKSELFTLLHEENIEFARFGLRQNIAQFCVLKMNKDLASTDDIAQPPCVITSPSLLVGNIHVLYNPKRGDIKLGQMRIFLEKAYELSQQYGQIPVILTGDLNSLPQSAIYQFLASSELNFRQFDRTHMSGQIFPSRFLEPKFKVNHVTSSLMNRWTEEEIMLATGSRLGGNRSLTHHLKLSSAYSEVPGSSEVRDRTGEPLATSYHSFFCGTVDYIWHTPDLFPVRVLETLPMTSLKQTGGLPSKQWGSDHLAIACELALRRRRRKKFLS
ncbi:Carbon catabolite repressor protein 4 homolog 5 [Striga hermonthica]|uniref:Carbon catabolite repressor protein 4 homolog 5 n=1 Tax=Striga hermonthica TaxID=68872 RepID=A0A9N7MY53_STRHE|nr:Carbon catabolite repressor protein 4 homolog 5 [Striga hermonthica]